MTKLSNVVELQNKEIKESAQKIKERSDCQDVTRNLVLISIYDEKLDKFSPITCYTSLEEAKMQFKNIVDHSNSMLSHYPENFYMYIVGEFNQDQGCIIETMVCDNPVNDAPLKIYEGLTECVCCLKELQSEEANSYYQVLNSVNASLNSMDEKLKRFSQIETELQNLSDTAAKRMARIDAIFDNNVDLFPLPVKSKDVALNLQQKAEKQGLLTKFIKK